MSFEKIWNRIKRMPKRYSIGGTLVVLVILILGVHFLTRSAAVLSTPSGIPHVTVASVASLSSATGPLPVTGKVTSLSQATILAESSGEITSLSHTIGDHVGAGAVIGEFENSSQEAAVLQAQGAYDGAQAALDKASGTSATNSGITSTQAAQNAANAETSAENSLQSAYASLDDAVHTKADQLFTNPRTASAALTLNVPDSELATTIVNERRALEQVLTDAKTLATPSGDSAIDANIATMTDDAQQVSTFLNNLIKAVNETQSSTSASSATLAADQSSLSAARTETVGAIGSLTSAKSAYDTSIASSATATNSADGGTTSDIASAQANLKEALGALDAAKANLEKTIIRSPISGTIVSLPVTEGDYVSSFSQVAVVSNPGALYVDTNVTSDDAKTLAVGNKATIGGTTPGVITFIAPALDPTTGKIEVKVGISGDTTGLTDGDIQTVTLNRTDTSITSTATTGIVIPIIAAKITPTGPVVFTVTASSTLVANPITLGSILGDEVTVLTGLTSDIDIVTDARGLTEGQTVVVDSD